MKVIAYLAISANGHIAKDDDSTDWVSEEQWEHFQKTVSKSDFAIMGRRTYEVMKPDEFVPDCHYIVLGGQLSDKITPPNVSFSSQQPEEVVASLRKHGGQHACLIGGAQTVTMFLQAKAVDELWLDIEPVLFGNGLNLIAESALEADLKLLEHTALPSGLVQLRYKLHYPA